MFSNYKLDPEALRFFQQAYESQMRGDYDSAIELYRRSLAIQPSAEGYTFLGWAYSFLGELDKAISYCHRAIATDPDFGNPYNDIGAYLLQQGKLTEAIPWLDKAKRALRYDNPEYAYCNLAKVHELRGLWPLAMQEYKDALKIRPDYAPAVAALLRLHPKLN